jgi:hypothetical protein
MGTSPVTINICNDFSDAPGARYKSDGPKSGEEFFEILLDPKFQEAVDKNTTLVINFDGTFGYATSFLSESFSLLKKKYGKRRLLDTLQFISDEDPHIITWTKNIISE